MVYLLVLFKIEFIWHVSPEVHIRVI